MSFELLKKEIIDEDLCQGCGLCAGSCDNIEMIDLHPTLVKNCILEPRGKICGQCYNLCPQVHQQSITTKLSDSVYSVKPTTTNDNNLDPVNNLVNTIGIYLLETKKITHLVKSIQGDDLKKSRTFTNSEQLKSDNSLAHGRTGILTELYENFHGNLEVLTKKLAIIGRPCEISGATTIANRLHKDLLKIGLFCKSSYPLPELKNYCLHCQDFAAVKSDISIGLEGSEGNFATIIAWTDRGKTLVSELLAKGVLTEGKCNIADIEREIETKKKRIIISHPITLRQQILKTIEEHPGKTMSELSTELNIPIMKVRYDTLRLVQEHKLGMLIRDNEPHFMQYFGTEEEEEEQELSNRCGFNMHNSRSNSKCC